VPRQAVGKILLEGAHADHITVTPRKTLSNVERECQESRHREGDPNPFARGAYSYATPKIREAQSGLKKPDGGAVFFSGEALYAGRDIGTVEAALASGRETAQKMLAAEA
jgi:hypothetical protein